MTTPRNPLRIPAFIGLALLTASVTSGCPSRTARPSVLMAPGTAFYDGASGAQLSPEAALERLSTRHVYVGERHGDAAFHRVQLSVIQALAAKGPVAVGVEWLNRDMQATVDRFSAGEIAWEAFDAAVGLTKRWRDKASAQHRRILEWCRDNKVPILGLNAPTGLSRTVARSGPEAVSEDLRRWLPALDTGNDAHKAYFAALMKAAARHHAPSSKTKGGGAHGGHHAMSASMLDRYYRAQLVWDESMATAASEYMRSAPKRRLIVLAGLGHVDHGHGIPLRVKAWVDAAPFAIVRPLGPEEAPAPTGAGPYPERLADVFWRAGN